MQSVLGGSSGEPGPDHDPVGLDRRSLLRLAAGGVIGVGTVGLPLGTASCGFATNSRDPVSMAMHIHGSLSEGRASMDAHLFQARRTGIDVIWWTDHDFRQSAAGYRRAVDFNGEEDPENALSWHWVPQRIGPLGDAGHEFVANPRSTERQGGALRLHAVAGQTPTWATYQLEAEAWNSTYSTSYADTTLRLDVLSGQLGPDAQVVVEVASSYRPATGGRPAGHYRMQYRVGARTGHWREERGLLGVISVAAGPPGQWQRLVMDLSADHARLWPDTVAGDASLWRLRVGVRAREGATARAVVDRLRFKRLRRSPADGAALLRSLVATYRDRYPDVTQHAASEVSLVQHLNAFGGDGVLPSYGSAAPHMDASPTAQREMVKFLHSHGALVCLNHPLGGLGPAGLAERLVATNGVGADVIEVGYADAVDTMARVFDVAARNAVFLTANGVTDDHGGLDWLGSGPRWVTGAWSRTRRSSDLCAALGAGAAWFYDPLYWRGDLDLLVEGRVPMGGVLFASDDRLSVRVTASELPRDGSLELIVGACDRPGLSDLRPRTRSRTVPARDVVAGSWSTHVSRGAGCYIRVMVRQANGAIVGFSNPVWVLPKRLRASVRVPRNRYHVAA